MGRRPYNISYQFPYRTALRAPDATAEVNPAQAAQPVIWLPHPSGRNRQLAGSGAAFMHYLTYSEYLRRLEEKKSVSRPDLDALAARARVALKKWKIGP